MRTFLRTAATLVPILIALWIPVVPVRCSVCQHTVFRTDVASLLFGGHGHVMHAVCSTEVAQANPSRRAWFDIDFHQAVPSHDL
jgi:hypothetical protein